MLPTMVISTDPTGALKFTLTFFTVCGLWRPDNKFFWPYIVYATIFQIIFLFCYVSFKCLNFLFLTDLNTIIKELYICCSELSLVVKVINFHYYQKEMKKFLLDIKSFQLLCVEEEDLLNKRLAKFKFLLAFQLISCVTAIIFSCGTPLFAKNTILPYPGWYPLDWSNDRTHFWIVYCYQVIGICYEANAVVILEMFLIYLMIVTGAHLDILAMRLMRLGEPTNEATDETMALRRDNDHLINSIDIYNNILKFQRTMERTFSVPLFIQFIISGIILCITSFQIAMIKPSEDIVNLIFYLSFTVVITLEIFLPCYFGTENIIKSNYLTTAVYSSNWTELSTPSKRIMITLMEGLLKPRVLLSGKLFSLTLSTFLVICNRTYSLFAVLKTFMK